MRVTLAFTGAVLPIVLTAGTAGAAAARRTITPHLIWP